MASFAAVHCISNTLERTIQWVFSQDIPSDITIKVDDATFPLHKFILVAKSGYIKRKIMESDRSDLEMLELNGIPGGPEAFEKAARFCYRFNFEISVQNAAALRCAAEWLEMTEASCVGNLAARASEFVGKAALSTLPGSVAVLKSCNALLPFADELGIVQLCVDAISFKVTQEIKSPSRSPDDWWTAELAQLTPPFFQKVIAALKPHNVAPKTLSSAIVAYAGKSLPELLPLSTTAPHFDPNRFIQRTFIESLIAILPADREAPLPAGFLCCLLRAAIFLNSSGTSRRDLERRISPSLDQLTVADLMTVAFDYSGQRLADLDSIRRIVAGFGECGLASAAAQRAARVVDAFVAQIAAEEDLLVTKFAGIAGALPKSARRFDDDLYRAVDIYLKEHSGLDEIEKEKACSVMDPLRLSYHARLHASQNKRLPLQVVLHALYYDQLKLRSNNTADELPICGQRADHALARENESLRVELAQMKLYLTDLQAGNAATCKKKAFFSSISKRLGKLNPFRKGSKDTSTIEVSVTADLGKHRKRRFSIS